MIIKSDVLTQFATRIFTSAGAEEARAASVATHLVEANLKGHDSHGVGMIPRYVSGIHNGYLVANNDMEIVQDSGAVLLLTAAWDSDRSLAGRRPNWVSNEPALMAWSVLDPAITITSVGSARMLRCVQLQV